MPQIKVVDRSKVPVQVSKKPSNDFDKLLLELEPNQALEIVPAPDDDKADNLPRWIGSIKMQLNNAGKRTNMRDKIDYWDDERAVYVALTNNVPVSNGHNN